jgi:hypothetical protein
VKTISDYPSVGEWLKRVIGCGKRDSTKLKAQDSSPKYGAIPLMNLT